MTKKQPIKFLCIHHTSVSYETQPAQFYAVNRYHKERWGMKSKLGYYTGYNYFIGTNGCLTQTREVGEETMAVIGHNFDSIHICLAGNFNVDYPVDEQKKTLVDFITDTLDEYPDIEIKLHKEMQENRTCPGLWFDRRYLQNNILNRIDREDKNKADKIKELSGILDRLRELLLNLLTKI